MEKKQTNRKVMAEIEPSCLNEQIICNNNYICELFV
jgi:hypothetical protein